MVRADKTVYETIVQRAHSDPGGDAILAPDRTTLRNGRLLDLVSRLPASLAPYGVRPGERVAIVMPNGPEMATCFLAVSTMAACAPLNPDYSVPEFEFYLSDLAPKVLIAPAMDAARARIAAANLGIPVIDLHYDDAADAGVFQLKAELGPGGTVQLASIDDLALVLHTSGTTSRPKMVPLTLRNLSSSASNIAKSLELTPQDRCLNVMPLFHIHGLMASVLATAYSGGSVVCAQAFSQLRSSIGCPTSRQPGSVRCPPSTRR